MTQYNMKKVILQSVDGDYLAPISSVAKEAQNALHADNADIAQVAYKDGDGSTITSKYELKQLPFTTLATSGNIYLVDNTVNSINIKGATTFILPTVTDNSYLHQMFIQINMTTVKTINLGTGVIFFNGKAPDLSKVGKYNLYYEYDKINAVWVCGSMKKEGAN